MEVSEEGGCGGSMSEEGRGWREMSEEGRGGGGDE